MPTALARSARPRRARATARVRELAAETGLAGIVLTAPGPVAWASGGVNVPVDRGAAVDTVWLAVGRDRTTLVTANVEERRLVDEFGDTDVDVRAVPWWDGDAMVTAAAEALGAAPDRIGADGHPGFGHDLSDALTARRLALGADEQDELRRLGVDAATALQSALRAWRPGDTDHAVAARVVAALESNGADAPVLIVGGDERVLRYRHPLAVGAAMDHLAMGVVVARRGGLHVATTRYATYGPADPGLMASLDAARAIHLDVLRACRPGARYGDALTALAAGYARTGHDGAWREHYQGGPIGFAQREFEIAPTQTASPWWTTAVADGGAVAWNPSTEGGGKDEDTFLVTAAGPELVTYAEDAGPWPGGDVDGVWRPEPLQRTT